VGAAESDQRLIQNVFRKANERLLAAVGDRIASDREIPFLCECHDPSCLSTVLLTVDDYRLVRQHERRFAVVPGHPTAVGESTVSRANGVSIVEKP
jgi:hypothetical protein